MSTDTGGIASAAPCDAQGSKDRVAEATPPVEIRLHKNNAAEWVMVIVLTPFAWIVRGWKKMRPPRQHRAERLCRRGGVMIVDERLDPPEISSLEEAERAEKRFPVLGYEPSEREKRVQVGKDFVTFMWWMTRRLGFAVAIAGLFEGLGVTWRGERDGPELMSLSAFVLALYVPIVPWPWKNRRR